MNDNYRRNYFTFGMGTIGRDMVYSLVSMFLIVYLTEVVNLPDATMWWITGIITAARIFDAVNDPVMGVVVDNTKSRWGKFKPWIVLGVGLSAIFTVLLFTDFGLRGAPFIILFAVVYLAWGISWTINDIAYWSMLPALAIDQDKRERMGAFARICANIGLFAIVGGIVFYIPMLENVFNSTSRAYTALAVIIVVVMLGFQFVTVFGVKESKITSEQKPTKLKDLFAVIFKNDQLLVVSIAMAVFMIGYVTTTSFGIYFFKYAFRNEEMFSLFAIVLGVSQLVSLSLFPLFSKKFNRRQLFTFGMILVVVGYIGFFFSPMNMLYIGISGILIFFGQAFIQLLMLMFLADSVEYGQWKLGKRNESITFSLQPFINKIGGAIATGIVAATLILSGINAGDGNEAAVDAVTDEGILLLKIVMLILPLIFIVVSYVIYRWKYKIDEKMFNQIVSDLKDRGELNV